VAADEVFSSGVAIGRGKVVNNVHGRHLDVDPPTEKVLWHGKAVMRCEIYTHGLLAIYSIANTYTLRKKGTKAVTGDVPFQKVHFCTLMVHIST